MKCQYCDNEANVFYTQLIDGKSKEIKLCESCAEAKGISFSDDFESADELIDDMKVKISSADALISANENQSECESCGFTLGDLRKIGRLGCSHCYTNFGAEVQNMLKNMHKGTEHKGRVPMGMIAAMKKKRKLQQLETALDKAIADENFEDAAKLRDELTAFKSSLKKKGGAVS